MRSTNGVSGPEILALQGLGWLAGDEDAFPRFLAASGVDGADLRAAAGAPETALAVLEFLLKNEDLLLRFCEDADVEPKAVHGAWARLDGGP